MTSGSDTNWREGAPVQWSGPQRPTPIRPQCSASAGTHRAPSPNASPGEPNTTKDFQQSDHYVIPDFRNPRDNDRQP